MLLCDCRLRFSTLHLMYLHCRRDRNRETALATYYRRKARIVELRGVVAALEAENAALDTLAYAAEGSEDCAGTERCVRLTLVVSCSNYGMPTHCNVCCEALLCSCGVRVQSAQSECVGLSFRCGAQGTSVRCWRVGASQR